MSAPQPTPENDPCECPASKVLQVTFAESGKTVSTDGECSILELAEKAGVQLPWGCRGGGCGLCKVRLRAGNVAMDCEDGLQRDDKKKGWVLACRGCPISDVILSA